jgi:predicted phosphodiesterase
LLPELAPPQIVPGRSCPLSYRYSPKVFDRPAEWAAETIYVIGGLYGNLEALDAIEHMAATETVPPRLVFNGDFHWFDAQADWFAELDRRVHRHTALRGNVETELASADDKAGCGCAYPESVDKADVERSNNILARLKQVAQNAKHLGSLPMHAVASVGGTRIAVVHGDAESLAGWRFDGAAMDVPENQAWLSDVFAQSKVDVFASSHTCTPALRNVSGCGVVVNNGSAGMASLAGATHGIITRVSTHAAPISLPVLHGAQHAGVHVDAVAVYFDDTRWQQRFLTAWPAGSDAHISYWNRICHGPSCPPVDRGARP